MSIELDQVTANSNDIARSVANSGDMVRDNYRGLLNFIMDVDDYVCDIQFTVALRDRLNEVIALEDE